jgi:hypothetical protein
MEGRNKHNISYIRQKTLLPARPSVEKRGWEQDTVGKWIV